MFGRLLPLVIIFQLPAEKCFSLSSFMILTRRWIKICVGFFKDEFTFIGYLYTTLKFSDLVFHRSFALCGSKQYHVNIKE